MKNFTSLLSIKDELEMYGGERLMQEDILALLLGIKPIKAAELISKYGTLEILIGQAANIRDITATQKAKLQALKELQRRINVKVEKTRVSSPDIIFEEYKAYYNSLEIEHFDIFLLDTKNQIKERINISKGTLNASIVHPREVFKEAIRAGANSILLAHNHPSGDSKPSDEDIRITERLELAGDLMGIKVLDHIIFGKNEYFSFKEKKII